MHPKSAAMILIQHPRYKKYSIKIEYVQVPQFHWQSLLPCYVPVESLLCVSSVAVILRVWLLYFFILLGKYYDMDYSSKLTLLFLL